MQGKFLSSMIVVGSLVGLAPGTSSAQTPVSPSSSIKPPAAKKFNEQNLDRLLQWAARLTNRKYPLAVKVPRVIAANSTQLSATICPDSPKACASVAAAYSVAEGSIVHRDTFDARRVLDRSFLVHELVHFLQHLEQGVELNLSCQVILSNETEAYLAQHAYLRRFGRPVPPGLYPSQVRCPLSMEASAQLEKSVDLSEGLPTLKNQYWTN